MSDSVIDSAAIWREDGHLRRLIDDNFIQYAAYVIRDRAIPDLDDGLKPVGETLTPIYLITSTQRSS